MRIGAHIALMKQEEIVVPADFLAQCPVELDAAVCGRLGAYLFELLETNRRHNLTAIRDPHEAWMRHILEVVYLADQISGNCASVIDIGSGGGIPGMPLAILRPDLPVSLLETTRKKADFLSATATKLGLENVRVINERAEEAAHDVAYREQFDAATCRAVGSLSEILELCIPFVKTGGLFYAVKGLKADQELAQAGNALTELSSRLVQNDSLMPGCADNESFLLCIRKEGATASKYPRRNGLPKKRPL